MTDAPRSLLSLSVLLLASLLAGCDGCTNGPSSVDGGSALGDAGGDDDCRLIAIGDIGLDVQFDTETVYSARTETVLGSEGVPDYLVFHFVNFNERIGPLAIGTFSLAESPNDNRGTCAECVSVFVDQLSESAVPTKVFFQSAGSITLEANPRNSVFEGRVQGLELVEVEIDGFTLESTPVPGGECLRIADFDVDYRFVPPEWTCDAELYGTGGLCNCDCGAYDPDCSCDPFMDPDCPAEIEDDCAAGTLCTFEGCKQECDVFSTPPVPCEGAEELCAFDSAGQVCIAAAGRVNGVALGEPCIGQSGFVQYCDVEDTVPRGMCDDFDATCRPLCFGTDMCPAEEACFTIAAGPPEEGGFGYCRPEEEDPDNGDDNAPAEWECPGEMYADGSICECACGAPDPDCDDPDNEMLGCGVGETCAEGVCE